jgi:hypothetical protein
LTAVISLTFARTSQLESFLHVLLDETLGNGHDLGHKLCP